MAEKKQRLEHTFDEAFESGQMFENVRTGRIGVIESNDKIYKTLLMRDVDGNSFNVSYATFRRMWKEYEGDVKLETSAQKTRKEKDFEKKFEKAKNNLKEEDPEVHTKTVKAQWLEPSECDRITADTRTVVEKYLKSNKLTDQIIIADIKKHCVVLKYKNKRILEIWPKLTRYTVGNTAMYMKKDLWDEVVFSKKVGMVEATIHDTWNMTHTFSVKNELFEAALDCVLKAIKEVIEKDLEEKEETEEDK